MSSLKRGMREFYMVVHPDFFHDFPEEKVYIILFVNGENSYMISW